MAVKNDPQQMPIAVVVVLGLLAALVWWWIMALDEPARRAYLGDIERLERAVVPVPKIGAGLGRYMAGTELPFKERLRLRGDKQLEDWLGEFFWVVEHRMGCLQGYGFLILQAVLFGLLGGGLQRDRDQMAGFGLGLFTLARLSVLFVMAGFIFYLIVPLPLSRSVGGSLLASCCGLSAWLFSRGRPKVH